MMRSFSGEPLASRQGGPFDVPRLPLATVEVEVQALEPVELPGWLGSMLHGALGGALRSLVCGDACARRHAQEPCAYALLFERPRSLKPLSGRVAATPPHPLVLRPPPPGPKRILEAGDTLRFGATLVGPAATTVGLFLAAVEEAGRIGLGRKRGRCAIAHVSSGRSTLGEPFVPGALGVTLRTLTPLRLYREGRLVRAPVLGDFLLAAGRRLEALDAYFGTGTTYYEDALLRESGNRMVPQHDEWRPFRVMRLSTRQHLRHPMEGIVGTAAWEGDASDFLPLLQAAALVGIGKATSFGFGLFSLESSPAPSRSE